MQITRIGPEPKKLTGYTRAEIAALITDLREERISAAADQTLSGGAFRSLSNYIDDRIRELEEAIPLD